MAVVVRRLAVLAALAACQTSPPASPAQAVYGSLVDAGCLADTDSGLEAVQEEGASDAAPSWLRCLWAGGTVASCGVPCQ